MAASDRKREASAPKRWRARSRLVAQRPRDRSRITLRRVFMDRLPKRKRGKGRRDARHGLRCPAQRAVFAVQRRRGHIRSRGTAPAAGAADFAPPGSARAGQGVRQRQQQLRGHQNRGEQSAQCGGSHAPRIDGEKRGTAAFERIGTARSSTMLAPLDRILVGANRGIVGQRVPDSPDPARVSRAVHTAAGAGAAGHLAARTVSPGVAFAVDPGVGQRRTRRPAAAVPPLPGLLDTRLRSVGSRRPRSGRGRSGRPAESCASACRRARQRGALRLPRPTVPRLR
jgi:hypothetical protein